MYEQAIFLGIQLKGTGKGRVLAIPERHVHQSLSDFLDFVLLVRILVDNGLDVCIEDVVPQPIASHNHEVSLLQLILGLFGFFRLISLRADLVGLIEYMLLFLAFEDYFKRPILVSEEGEARVSDVGHFQEMGFRVDSHDDAGARADFLVVSRNFDQQVFGLLQILDFILREKQLNVAHQFSRKFGRVVAELVPLRNSISHCQYLLVVDPGVFSALGLLVRVRVVERHRFEFEIRLWKQSEGQVMIDEEKRNQF